jgi:hypothetical protein
VSVILYHRKAHIRSITPHYSTLLVL